ncbi:hypothetical protein [Vibrio phage V-YDF132]|nr:hypothetical protein [Vibrio phage V-YDF132]
MGTHTLEQSFIKLSREIFGIVNEMSRTHNLLVELVKEMPLMQQVTVQRALNKGWILSKVEGNEVKMYTKSKQGNTIYMVVVEDGSYTR